MRVAIIDLIREIRAAETAVIDDAVRQVRSRLSAVVSRVVNGARTGSEEALYSLVVAQLSEGVIPQYLPAEAISAQRSSWTQQIVSRLSAAIRSKLDFRLSFDLE